MRTCVCNRTEDKVDPDFRNLLISIRAAEGGHHHWTEREERGEMRE